MEEPIDLKKEKDAAKSMLKLVEEGLNEQKIKNDRKSVTKGDRIICPSSNWNSVRKKIGIYECDYVL